MAASLHHDDALCSRILRQQVLICICNTKTLDKCFTVSTSTLPPQSFHVIRKLCYGVNDSPMTMMNELYDQVSLCSCEDG